MYKHMFEKIKADDALKKKIEERLDTMGAEKHKKKISGVVLVAACIVVGASTAFAATSPAVQQAISNVISYFESEKANPLSDEAALLQYNKAVGLSCSRDGYNITVDNIAADDNFIHIFYTVTSDEPFDNPYYGGVFGMPNLVYRIDGAMARMGNHNESDSYYADEHTLKGVDKINISEMTLPEQFFLELYTNQIGDSEPSLKGSDSRYKELYNYEKNVILTDEDKEKLWSIGVQINKADVQADSVVKNVNKKVNLNNTDFTVKKVIMSPFGNQITIDGIANFALYDDKGNSLDVLNTDLQGGGDNAYEFLKADKNMRSLTLVPLKETPTDQPMDKVVMDLDQFPIRAEMSEYGSLVITGVSIDENVVKVDYYKDGFIPYDPGMSLLDGSGNDDFGSRCLLDIRVNHESNSYTAVYTFYDEQDGKPGIYKPAQDVIDKVSQISKIELYQIGGIVPDMDNGVKIDLN